MMRKLTALALSALLSSGSMAQVYNPNIGPNNPKNSQYNPDNTQYNTRNSPYNPENSPYYSSSKNGVYDNWGNRNGYEVQAPSGA